MKADLGFSAKPYSQPYASVGLEILDNFYVETATSSTAKKGYYYVGIQGLHLLLASSGTNLCRGLFTTSEYRTFGVWGNALVEITAAGTVRVNRGTLNSSSGIVRFAENGKQMILVDGERGYIFDLTSSTFGQITDEYFPGVADGDYTKGPSHVVCLDTYFLVNSRGTNKYYWSAPGYVAYAFDSTQPSVLNLWWGTAYAQKIGDTDNIVGIIALPTILGVFGNNSMEFHYDSGNTAGQVFRRQESSVVNFGCLSADSICRYGNGFYWLGQDRSGTIGIFTVGMDFMPHRISTRGIETRIQAYEKINDCWSYSYAVDGHAFVLFNFPSGTSEDGGSVTGATWAYDVTTDTWTRRSRWQASEGRAYRYAGQFAAYNEAWGMEILGDWRSDALYYLDNEQYFNHTASGEVEYIQARFTTPIGYESNKMLIYDCIQLNHQPGFSPRTGQGSDPVWMMSSSNDTGLTFGYERSASAGKTGEYRRRTRWLKLGRSRNQVFRFRASDPFKRVITGYTIDIRECSR